MRKISNEKLNELLEDAFSEDYVKELGLEGSKKQVNKSVSLVEKKEVTNKKDKSVFLSDEEWKNGDFPLPTF